MKKKILILDDYKPLKKTFINSLKNYNLTLKLSKKTNTYKSILG